MAKPFKLITRLVPAVLTLALFFGQALPAFACGSLVAPDGDVRLSRAATLVAWHDGIEHYLTSFSYQGSESNVGWIVPLPAVPLSIQDGGAWTLQRLFRETHPLPQEEFAGAAAVTDAPAVVVEQVKVEALNVTVLKGSGQAVLDWCAANGFLITGDTRAHLLTYAQGSPIFMAAKYDTAAARARGQLTGDGVPLLLTLRIPHIWVPLEVLALDGQQVQADLYLLTDRPLNVSATGAVIGQSPVDQQVPGAPGLTVQYQEQVNPSLYHDLSTDRNMGWVWQGAWLTYLSLDAPDNTVTYDLGVSPDGVIRVAPFGTAPMLVAGGVDATVPGWLPRMPIGTPEVALLLAALVVIAGVLAVAFGVLPRRKAAGANVPR
jgi:hypothetical protein